MDEKPSWFKRNVGEATGLAVFVLLLFFGDWLVHAASIPTFRLKPSAVPDNFFMMVRMPGGSYDLLSWKDYPGAKAGRRVQTFLLPEASGSLRGKATFSYTVLENDGARQLVEVKYDGAYKSASRYVAYADRVVPVAYRSFIWGHTQNWHIAALAAAFALAGLAAWGAAFGVKRLMRLQRT